MTQDQTMIPFDDALRIVDETLAGVAPRGETVPAREALGRVLLAHQFSRLDLPPFNKSAMDGYAVLADDERDEYRLLETIPAGRVGTEPLVPGATVKFMTGAAVPAGTAKVIMIEQTQEQGDAVRVHDHSGRPNICLQAEDVSRGDLIMSAGTILTPLHVANLISCGITGVPVAHRIRLAIISTGDEIVDSPDLIKPGKIMDTNSPLLAGLAEQGGLEVVSEQALPDEPEATVAGIRSALDAADIVVLSGGVSVGDFDFVTQALSDLGLTLHFTRVAVKPGKPMTYASAPGKAVFGLPGNPVSVHLMFHLFVRRAAALMTGAPVGLRELSLPLGSDFKRRKTERQEYVPASITQDARVEPVEFHGSAHLAALLQADGFIVVPAGVPELPEGEVAAFIPFVGPLR